MHQGTIVIVKRYDDGEYFHLSRSDFYHAREDFDNDLKSALDKAGPNFAHAVAMFDGDVSTYLPNLTTDERYTLASHLSATN